MNIKILTKLTIILLSIQTPLFFFDDIAPQLTSTACLAAIFACTACLAANFVIEFIAPHVVQQQYILTTNRHNMHTQSLKTQLLDAADQLLDAAGNGDTETAVALIEKGANIHATDWFGRTPLHWAARSGHTKTALALIESGANVNAADRHGYTPLHLAVENGHTEIALALIANGANPSAANRDGNSPLHYAAEKGHTEIALALIANGANPNAADFRSCTPLHWAARKGHTSIALALIEKGANPSAANDDDKTPLHHAAQYGHTEIALKLINAGADPNMANHNDNTPLHLATYYGYTDIAVTLIKMGADVHATDHRPRTPLYIAIARNKLATALTIIYYGKVSGVNVATIEANPTSQYIQRLYSQANNFRTLSDARGFFAGMNASYRQTMMAGMKIQVMATGIKDSYLTIMNLLRDKSLSKKRAPSSLPYSVLEIILQYAGLLPPNLDINLGKLPNLVKTSSTDLKAEARKQDFALIIPERRSLPVCTLRRGQ